MDTVLSVCSISWCMLYHHSPKKERRKKKSPAKIQAKFLVIMTSPPCGPISLHLKVTLPSHQHSQRPISTATHLWLSCSMFTAFIPLIKKAVMGSGCGTFVQAMTAALVNSAACRWLTWWGRLRCHGAITKQTTWAEFNKYLFGRIIEILEQIFFFTKV